MKRNFISSEMSYKTYLKQLYFDPEKPGSYGSVNKLYRAVRKEGKYVLGQIQPDDTDNSGLYCLCYFKRRHRGTRTTN